MESQTTSWQRYMKHIIIAGILAIIASFTWGYVEYQKRHRFEEASVHYENMLQALRQKDTKKASEEATLLTEQYARTPYASLGAMMLARFSLEHQDTAKAILHLKVAVKQGMGGPVEHIARVRLARVLVGDEQYDEAFNLLQVKNPPEGYVTLYEEIKGDIYLKQNNVEKAKESYMAALKAAPQGVPTTALQLKHSDLSDKEES